MKITKLVLPVAGRGKRLQPLTNHAPKNLIKVGGRPLIEYVLKEAVLSGIREIILVVNPDHLSAFKRYLAERARVFTGLKFHIRFQETPGGNGHAIVKAYDLLRNEPFAVRFCDDVLVDKKPVLESLINIFENFHSPVLLLERVPKSLVSRFGVVGVKRVKSEKLKLKSGIDGKLYRIMKIVEKPKAKEAPSNLTVVGGYILTSSTLKNLKSVADTLPVVADDALPVAVAFQIELLLGKAVYGWEFRGQRLDCGTLEKLRKVESFISKHPEIVQQ